MSNGIVHPANFVRFEAFFLPRVRSRGPESPRANGRYSPGLLPLQSFSLSTLGTSNPPEHEARTRALARRPKLATLRTAAPGAG
jgi:hypothetical protein